MKNKLNSMADYLYYNSFIIDRIYQDSSGFELNYTNMIHIIQ